MQKLSSVKKALDKIKADIVLSVGSSCMCATRIEEFELRKEASPLDWMMVYDLNVAYELMKSDFKDFFMECENLGEFNPVHLRVRDKKTGMVSIHHFETKQALENQIIDFNALSVRRWRKIKERILHSHEIVFMYSGEYNLELFASFLQRISALFGEEKNYFLISVLNDEKKEFNEIQITQYELSKTLKIITYLGNNKNISNNEAEFWRGNSFLWTEVMKNITLDEKPIGAVLRVKNHLAYQLGEAMIVASKSIFTLLALPFLLLYVVKKYKKDCSESTKNILNLKDYRDYEEALKVQNGFAYRLGLCLIQARNGGGYLNCL